MESMQIIQPLLAGHHFPQFLSAMMLNLWLQNLVLCDIACLHPLYGSMVDQLAVHTIYATQLSLKKPGFLYEANKCLHLLQLLAKNVTGGFALVQMIPGQCTERVSPNGYFPDILFTKTDKSRKTFLENPLPNGYFQNMLLWRI